MKKLIFLIILILIFISCGESDTIKSASEKALELPDKAEALTDITNLRGAIRNYYSINQKYPSNLEELNIKTICPIEDFEYDKNTGEVKHKHYKNY